MISKVHMVFAKFQNIDGNREIILISCSFDFLIDWSKDKQQKMKNDNCYQALIANITNWNTIDKEWNLRLRKE